MAKHKYATTPPNIATMPPGVPYIIGNEAAERFSFYGMRSILIIFMTQYMVTSSGAGSHGRRGGAAVFRALCLGGLLPADPGRHPRRRFHWQISHDLLALARLLRRPFRARLE